MDGMLGFMAMVGFFYFLFFVLLSLIMVFSLPKGDDSFIEHAVASLALGGGTVYLISLPYLRIAHNYTVCSFTVWLANFVIIVTIAEVFIEYKIGWKSLVGLLVAVFILTSIYQRWLCGDKEWSE